MMNTHLKRSRRCHNYIFKTVQSQSFEIVFDVEDMLRDFIRPYDIEPAAYDDCRVLNIDKKYFIEIRDYVRVNFQREVAVDADDVQDFVIDEVLDRRTWSAPYVKYGDRAERIDDFCDKLCRDFSVREILRGINLVHLSFRIFILTMILQRCYRLRIIFDYLYQFFLKIKDIINKDGGNDADRPEIREFNKLLFHYDFGCLFIESRRKMVASPPNTRVIPSLMLPATATAIPDATAVAPVQKAF
jgi:hypothetical protein